MSSAAAAIVTVSSQTICLGSTSPGYWEITKSTIGSKMKVHFLTTIGDDHFDVQIEDVKFDLISRSGYLALPAP